ncbi:hypothetical protein HDU91_005062 [Kappamyces sp. JEL0680]|nr:hypothetical protein HDU91_005062 [Kappamyces sp. JEL0680]
MAASFSTTILSKITHYRFDSLLDVMDCIRALHVYGFMSFWTSQIILDPLWCLGKAVELTKTFLLVPSTWGITRPFASHHMSLLHYAVSAPHHMLHWIDALPHTIAERAERFLLIAAILKTDTVAAIIDGTGFKFAEWDIVETEYPPTQPAGTEQDQSVVMDIQSWWDGTLYQDQVQDIAHEHLFDSGIDAMTFAQGEIKRMLLYRKIISFSRRVKYAPITTQNLDAEQLMLHRELLSHLLHLDYCLLVVDLAMPRRRKSSRVSQFSLVQTLGFLAQLAVLHYETVDRSDNTFALEYQGLEDYSSLQVVLCAFDAMMVVLDMICVYPKIPSPYLCNISTTLMDVCLISTLTLAALVHRQPLAPEEMCVARRIQHEILPILDSVDAVWKGARKMCAKCAVLLQQISGL